MTLGLLYFIFYSPRPIFFFLGYFTGTLLIMDKAHYIIGKRAVYAPGLYEKFKSVQDPPFHCLFRLSCWYPTHTGTHTRLSKIGDFLLSISVDGNIPFSCSVQTSPYFYLFNDGFNGPLLGFGCCCPADSVTSRPSSSSKQKHQADGKTPLPTGMCVITLMVTIYQKYVHSFIFFYFYSSFFPSLFLTLGLVLGAAVQFPKALALP